MGDDVGRLKVGVGVALGMIACAASAHATTYRGFRDLGTGTVKISITTDGAIGGLTEADILAFDIIVTDGSGTAEITNLNGAVSYGTCCGQHDLKATATTLTYNFADFPVGGENVLFQEGGIGSGGPFYCLQANACFDGNYAGEGLNSQPGSPGDLVASVRAYPLSDVIGSTVPEPATWGSMLLGVLGLGLAVRVRRSKTRAVAA
jgi:hypothetical protein